MNKRFKSVREFEDLLNTLTLTRDKESNRKARMEIIAAYAEIESDRRALLSAVKRLRGLSKKVKT